MKKVLTYLSVLVLVCGCVSLYDKNGLIVDARGDHEIESRIDHFINENGDTLHYAASENIEVHIKGTYMGEAGRRIERYGNVTYWLAYVDKSRVKTTKSHVTMLSDGCIETVLNADGGASGRVLFWGDYVYVTITPREDGIWCSFRIKRK